MTGDDSPQESMRFSDYFDLGLIPWLFVAIYLLSRPFAWVYREVNRRV